ncbi:MAG TPA: cytochrome ubiquinol oxidase subunit I [Pyrinomonadaceae bacterium]|jgi:cytochrome d ubiquinol oxidase subunit I|nr:cytochrome ubiquinol oxidase subunit I [Pyrinomonadaceae bacterium]
MDDILAARSQMAMSLAFHIIFASIGIAMPLLMVIAEWRWLRTKDEVYLTLAKHWAKGTAILFAVGAVSGTVLSFELGLLFPGFMGFAGSIIGMPFSLEGFAFFTEAIFLGIYLYGWQRVSRNVHLFSGVMVAVSGALSGIFVVIANAWMNAPTGFRLIDGKAVDVDPIAAMMNAAAFPQVLHMILASYAATGFAVAGIHAFMLLRERNSTFHKYALGIALIVGGVTAVLQPLSGDILAKTVAKNQPIKLAAMEGQFETERAAPLRIGGIPDEAAKVTRYAIELPYGLSFLAYGDPNAEVAGLNDFPADQHPPVAIVHFSFQIMVACGMAMMLLAVWGAWRWVKARKNKSKNWFDSKWFLRALVIAAPLGFIATETGWTVTEVGRQPWVIYNVMRTADAVTPMPHLIIPFLTFTFLYIFLAVITAWLLLRQVAASPAAGAETEATDAA